MSETRLKGIPICEGIAIGNVFFAPSDEETLIPNFSITVTEVEREIGRYRQALFSSRNDLQNLRSNLAKAGSLEAVTIIDTHIEMLDDPFMTSQVEDRIRKLKRNTETVFRSVIGDFESRLSRVTNTLFKQRLIDVMDLSSRILAHLTSPLPKHLSELPSDAIIIIKDLPPSYPASIESDLGGGILSQHGGKSSHAALISRAKRIPYVAGINIEDLKSEGLMRIIIDGSSGDVVLNPSPETEEFYRKLAEKQKLTLSRGKTKAKARAALANKTQVTASIGSVEEIQELGSYEVSQVGLFRTEFIALKNPSFFSSEDEQVAVYSDLLKNAGDSSVTIRVFDIGGDKELVRTPTRDRNPLFDTRGIKFLLSQPNIFKTQLRAILKAAVHGKAKILLPLISDVEEVRETRKLLSEVREELAKEDPKFYRKIPSSIPLGVMVEMPSAALTADLLAKESDFFSIGTNDLVQYTLGIDRNRVKDHFAFQAAHPSIVRLIKMVVAVGRRERKPVVLCGSVASEPLFVPLLVGLGIDELASVPPAIPLVHRALQALPMSVALEVADAALTLSSGKEIGELLRKTGERLFPDII